jgi:NAD(P)H-quinone oxidoreductase subunit 4L
VAIATILVCVYAWGSLAAAQLAAAHPMTHMPEFTGGLAGILANLEAGFHAPPDVVIGIGLAVLAVLAILFGADIPIIMITGSLAVFVTLTLMQSEPIRYMTLAALLFCIGFYGLVVSRNAVRVLMSIELMLNAVNINLVALARFIDPAGIRGQVFAVFILTVAAAEAAVGLAIVLAIYRNMATVDMEKFNLLKW